MRQTTVAAIVQVRMGSTRLPGKALKKIGGKSLLEILIGRLKTSSQIDAIVVATTEKPEDDAIAAAAADLGVTVYRGSEDDVLERFIGAAGAAAADIVVRVTGDNPLTDPALMDTLITEHRTGGADYTYCPGAPPGISVEVVNRAALEKIAAVTTAPEYREHVTFYILDQPESWKINAVPIQGPGEGFTSLRLTVDTGADLALLEKLYLNLGDLEKLHTGEAIAFLNGHPEIRAVNAEVRQHAPKSGKKITVILRSYNQQEFVRDAVESALGQTLPAALYEVLVIDDGSSDASPGILKTYGNRIRLRLQENQGAIKAVNTGLANARGEYIIILDADDTFEPDILAKMLVILESERDTGFAYCDYFEKNLASGETKVVSLKDNIFNSVGGGIMFRKEILEAAGRYDESLVFPEYDMLIKVMKQYKGRHIRQPLFTYNRHQGSITSDPARVKEGMRQLFERYGEIKGLRDY